MMKKKHLGFLLLCSMLFSTNVLSHNFEGSKLQFQLDYRYYLGLKQKNEGYSISRKDAAMYGNSIRASVMYHVIPRLALGAGIGADRYDNPGYNTFPVFAAFRYSPLRQSLAPYAFTNVGYSFETSTADRGMFWDLGVGYKRMFRKHFGLKFEIGYNLKNLRLDSYSMDANNNYSPKCYSLVRHSLFAGVGLVF